MSNVITGNPIVIDTQAATVVVANQFRVHAIIWDPVTAIANSDAISVKDKNGVVKYSRTYTTGDLLNETILFFSKPVLFDGLIVDALTHGKLYIYLVDNNNLKAS